MAESGGLPSWVEAWVGKVVQVHVHGDPDPLFGVLEDWDARGVVLRHTEDMVRPAFFRVGEARGGLLVKFYAGEELSEEELLSDFEQNGLQAGRLKREGRLLMRAEEEPLGGSRGEQLGRLIEEEGGEGRTVWASFDWVKPVELEAALEQQRQLSELVDARQLVVKTAAIEEAIEEWTASQLRRVQSAHSAMILASEEGLSLSRATPMPPS
jgi:hypothetical protein